MTWILLQILLIECHSLFRFLQSASSFGIYRVKQCFGWLCSDRGLLFDLRELSAYWINELFHCWSLISLLDFTLQILQAIPSSEILNRLWVSIRHVHPLVFCGAVRMNWISGYTQQHFLKDQWPSVGNVLFPSIPSIYSPLTPFQFGNGLCDGCSCLHFYYVTEWFQK